MTKSEISFEAKKGIVLGSYEPYDYIGCYSDDSFFLS